MTQGGYKWTFDWNTKSYHFGVGPCGVDVYWSESNKVWYWEVHTAFNIIEGECATCVGAMTDVEEKIRELMMTMSEWLEK